MMRDRVRSPPPRHGRDYSPSYRQSTDNQRDHQYPPRRGREHSPQHRQAPGRDQRYLSPHGLRDRDSQFGHFSNSGYQERERSRQGAGGASGSRERIDYGRDLGGERDRRLVELPRYNEDLGRRGTGSTKIHGDHSERINRGAKSGREYPSGSMEGTDYDRHMNENRDRQSWKMLNPNKSLPQRNASYAMFQGKYGLGESEKINSTSTGSPKYFLEYGGSSTSIKGNSQFEGLGVSRTMVEKPMYPKTDLTFSTYAPQSGHKRSYPDVGGSGSYSPLKKFSGGLHKDEKLQLDDDFSREKIYGDRHPLYTREGDMSRLYSKDEKTQWHSREEENPRFYSRKEYPQLYSREEKPQSYSQEEKPQLYSRGEKPYSIYGERDSQFSLKDSLRHELPSSQYKASTVDPCGSSMNDLRHTYKDSLPVGSDGYKRSSGYLTSPLPTKNPKLFVEDATNYRKDKLNPNLGTHMDYSYSTARRNDYTEIVPLPDKPYGKLSVRKDDYRHIDPLESRIIDPILDGGRSRREHPNEQRLWDDFRSPLERVVSSYLDSSRSSYAIASNVEGLGSKKIDLRDEGEVYRRHESKHFREDYGYEPDKVLQPHDERMSSYLGEDYAYGRDAGLQDERVNSHTSKDYKHDFDRVDQVFDRNYCDPLEGVEAGDVGMLMQPKVSKRRSDISERLSNNRNFSNKARDYRPKQSLLDSRRYRHPWVTRKLKAFESEGGSVDKARVLNPGVRDIKKRLGRARPVERIVVKHAVIKKNRKVVMKNKDGDGIIQAQEESPLEHGVDTARSEPPEKSEEFKQLVRNAFFKFVKQLNENTAEVKRFKEQGKAGSLKCWVCGSDSDEFSDTENLVKHACTATRVGFRSQHLGFHKALCTLMGWKAAEIHNNEWVLEALSVAEIASLKKDLILWPPLVIVYNSSIEKSNPHGQVAVSVEGLETMIKDMGFGEKTKVCRGKPVNQSIMVVKFSATYSGFQEAQRLHKFFADNKHGRNDFLKSKSKGPINTPKASAINMQDVLYGFLGISRDLNKLDSETKKRCVVRSKKEIQDLGDAHLKAEHE